MKGLFSILLLSNAAFFLWQTFWAPEQGEATPFQGVAIVNDGLLLLNELQEEKLPAVRDLVVLGEAADTRAQEDKRAVKAEAESTEVSESVSVTGCYESPLLDNLPMAEALQQILSSYGVEQSVRKTLSVRRVNYWVQLPAYKTLAAAEKVAGQLKRNRIKDFFIVKTGQHQNAISLGVYSSKERAEERISEIVALQSRIGKPVIEGLEMTVKQLVVQISVEEGQLSDELVGLLRKSGEEWKKIPCK